MHSRLRQARTIPIGLLLGAALLVASGCDSHPAVTVRNGTIEVRHGVDLSSLLHGVIGVRPGSSTTDVQRAFGKPFAKTGSTFDGRPDTCWAYRARQPDSSLSALNFCVNGAQRVDRILIGVHG
jgi:hypothetical protein